MLLKNLNQIDSIYYIATTFFATINLGWNVHDKTRPRRCRTASNFVTQAKAVLIKEVSDLFLKLHFPSIPNGTSKPNSLSHWETSDYI